MRLEWTEPAILDLRAIRDYIGRESETYAAAFVGRILEAVEALVDFPEMGRPVPEAEDPAVRELVFQTYRIIYCVEAERILLLAVIHGSRDLTQHPGPWELRPD